MNAAVVHSFNEAPSYANFDDPVPTEEESIVQVTAAGLHPIVKALAAGTHYGSTGELPFIAGVDGVGRLPDGTRVYFGVTRRPFGTFAELAPAARGRWLRLPDSIDEATAAGIANPGMSSWVALLFRARFVAGESVLILGATGSAGRLAVQIASRLGARRVIAVGRNPQALEQLKELGADVTISLEQDHDALVSALRSEWAEGGVDVVLDYLWGHPAETLLEAIAQKGLLQASARVRFVQIGTSAGPTISLPGATLRSSGLELMGSGFGSASMEQIFRALGDFFKEAAKSPFQVDVKSVPLREVEALWDSKESGGRVVFRP